LLPRTTKYISINLFSSKIFPNIPKTEQLTIKTTNVYILTTISKFSSSTMNNIQLKHTTNHLQKILFPTYSSMINKTQKSIINHQNKIFISLSISLILILLCISLSYCIFIYLNHCLNMNSNFKQDISGLNRVSFTCSEDSNDIQLYIYKTKNDLLSDVIDKKNEERRSSADSVKLFRY